MLRSVCIGVLLASALGLATGCGSSGGGGDVEASPDNNRRYVLSELGEMLRLRMLDTNKPPQGKADFMRYENAAPAALRRLQNGDLVLLWGANPKDGASDTVLAYEKETPQSGGFVLMQDGTTVKKMTAEEFKAAPKAGTSGSASGGAAKTK